MRSCPLASSCVRPTSLPAALLSRRDWVKRFAIGSAVTLVGGTFKTMLLADISPAANPANILEFDISLLPTLQSTYGSMRFNLFGTTIANGIITITRAPGNVFYAMSAYCTHAGCIVNPYDPAPGAESMTCDCHGSVYDIQGNVIDGAVTGQANLPAYNTSFSGNIVSVEIPNLNLKVNSIGLQSINGATRRYALAFPTKQGARYRVQYTPDLTTPPVAHPFYTTATGTMSVLIVTQSAPAPNPRTVYVDSTATSGFYMVEMVVDQYVA